MISDVFSNDANLDTSLSYLQRLIDGPLANATFAARVAEIEQMISEPVANDPTAFYFFAEFQQNQNTTVDRFYRLRAFINYRVANMSQQLSGEIA